MMLNFYSNYMRSASEVTLNAPFNRYIFKITFLKSKIETMFFALDKYNF